ncbi:little elongation complex subunit 2 isoform X2 [Salarias fasciatus]|nr:little elongation complex subunit 2 isoform X2 [Salarias fasciatus]
MSSLSSKEHNIYLGFLTSKKKSDPPQGLQKRVNDEVMQFTRYLQDVAKICADDYNFISQGAMQYSEDCLRACLEHVRTLPQLYQIHEMTSLTGGTFNPELALTFEKQLLTLGSVNITDHQIVSADAQLASDYQSVSSENPPAKKAKDMHATISDDGNAEKLCARYEPHVCLSRDALVRLLDNHGPDFVEQWELPVCVKLNHGKGSNQKKTVFIDSPLLKTEMTVRERSHIFHEESLKLSFRKNGIKKMFHLLTELPTNECQHSQEKPRRNCGPLKDGIDFEVDITELETFGESTSAKPMQEKQDHSVKSKQLTSPPLSRTTGDVSGRPVSEFSTAQEGSYSTSTSSEDLATTVTQPTVDDAAEPKTERAGRECVQETEDDSDDEKLVIDDCASAASRRQPKSPAGDGPPVTQPGPGTPDSPPPPRGAAPGRRQSRTPKVPGDQLSEILRMQTAMLKSSSDTAKPSPASPARRAEPVVHSHPTSLVKPCVSSYLERNQNEEENSSAVSHESSLVNPNTTEHKRILSQDLQETAEDEQDYEAPVEGNLLYKLYSLQNMLLMVRSSISLTHSRRVGSSQNQFVPVHVLPKLEYQLSYGVECLTNGEVCQLWTETLLHSSTLPYIAHINAHTSKVALLRKLPDDWKQSISSGFKLSKSLNILHHLLKKLTGLDEGRYLMVHKAREPFVTLLRAADGKASRGLYSLQQVHPSTPQPPASGLLPWVPVSPAVVLSFHQKHGRVPCTFPPRQSPKTGKDGSSNAASGPKSDLNTQGKKKKKKKQKNRAAKRQKYINKLVQKSV